MTQPTPTPQGTPKGIIPPRWFNRLLAKFAFTFYTRCGDETEPHWYLHRDQYLEGKWDNLMATIYAAAKEQS
jgi:hypothetical protein